MRKLLPALFIILIAVSSVLAAPSPPGPNEYGSLVLDVHLKDTVAVQGSGRIDSLSAELLWYPRTDYRQQVDSLTTTPQATLTDRGYLYAWRSPRQRTFSFALDARVETTDKALPVKEKIPFPIMSLPPDVARYTEPGELIDINSDIRERALALAADKGDLFEVVFTAADWVTTNIEYNISTLTLDATQKSSWVYANREGVCDEMTALFISMLRSLGIPARFVSGLSYTNLPEFANPWGGHGWAEVYFPDVGWVPFDVTYGTYGYIDPSHIKLQDSFDSKSDSVGFEMLASDSSLVTRSVETVVDIVEQTKDADRPLSVTLEPFDSNIALDSYNLITAHVENTADHYVSARFTLAKTEGLRTIGKEQQNLLLKPREVRTLRYVVQTENLADGFYYQLPVLLYVGLTQAANTSFEARQGYARYDRAFFDSYLGSQQPEKEYNQLAKLECDAQPQTAYVGDKVEVRCTLENRASSQLYGVDLCLRGCERIEVAPKATARTGASFTCDEPGLKASIATAKSRQISLSAIPRYTCLDKAQVEVSDVEMPAKLRYDEGGDITFSVLRTSESIPERVNVTVQHDNFAESWLVDDLVAPRQFTLSIHGRDLDLSENEVKILVRFQDALNNSYVSTATGSIVPDRFTFLERMQVRMLNMQRWIEGLWR